MSRRFDLADFTLDELEEELAQRSHDRSAAFHRRRSQHEHGERWGIRYSRSSGRYMSHPDSEIYRQGYGNGHDFQGSDHNFVPEFETYASDYDLDQEEFDRRFALALAGEEISSIPAHRGNGHSRDGHYETPSRHHELYYNDGAPNRRSGIEYHHATRPTRLRASMREEYEQFPRDFEEGNRSRLHDENGQRNPAPVNNFGSRRNNVGESLQMCNQRRPGPVRAPPPRPQTPFSGLSHHFPSFSLRHSDSLSPNPLSRFPMGRRGAFDYGRPSRAPSMDDMLPMDDVPLIATGSRIDTSRYVTADCSPPAGTECPVCMDEAGPQGLVKATNCGHYFHQACLDEWVNGPNDNSNLCPVCRQPMCREQRRRVLDFRGLR